MVSMMMSMKFQNYSFELTNLMPGGKATVKSEKCDNICKSKF